MQQTLPPGPIASFALQLTLNAVAVVQRLVLAAALAGSQCNTPTAGDRVANATLAIHRLDRLAAV